MTERDIDVFETWELVEELKEREGVKTIDIEPYQEYFVQPVGVNRTSDTGPAIILIVTD